MIEGAKNAQPCDDLNSPPHGSGNQRRGYSSIKGTYIQLVVLYIGIILNQ